MCNNIMKTRITPQTKCEKNCCILAKVFLMLCLRGDSGLHNIIAHFVGLGNNAFTADSVFENDFQMVLHVCSFIFLLAFLINLCHAEYI